MTYLNKVGKPSRSDEFDASLLRLLSRLEHETKSPTETKERAPAGTYDALLANVTLET